MGKYSQQSDFINFKSKMKTEKQNFNGFMSFPQENKYQQNRQWLWIFFIFFGYSFLNFWFLWKLDLLEQKIHKNSEKYLATVLKVFKCNLILSLAPGIQLG